MGVVKHLWESRETVKYRHHKVSRDVISLLGKNEIGFREITVIYKDAHFPTERKALVVNLNIQSIPILG